MPPPADPAAGPPSYCDVEAALLSRWPETRLDPSLDRIRALVALLAEPQRGYPVVHLTGTNGKTTTSRLVDALLRGRGLRTGRFTSPHVESMTERIAVDGEPLSGDAFVRAYQDVAPYAAIVDARQPHPLSFFELLVAMAYSAFADAPVDVAVVEVGMGGVWDATNVADGAVAVVTPVSVDHAHYLGAALEQIAAEKAGIIKPGATVVVAEQHEEVWAVLSDRAADVGAPVLREGVDFGVAARVPAVGGQVVTLRGLAGEYRDVFLPLFGAHHAQNAALALAAVEAFGDGEALDEGLVREAFAAVSSPGRLEVVRRSPAIVLDAAHNPHGMAATVEALRDSFTFHPLVGVVGVMADKDVEGILAELEPVLSEVVVTQAATSRAMPAEELGEVAREMFGEHRVRVAPRLDDALDEAVTLAETGGGSAGSIGTGGVLVTGSVVTVGEARLLLAARGEGRS